MTWVPLLLADRSPCLRLAVLRDLLGRGDDDPEVAELLALRDTDPLVAPLLAAQRPDGSWELDALGISGGTTQRTAYALARLGYLGYGPEHPAVARGAEWLFARQRDDGSWPLPENRVESDGHAGYTMMPLQTAIPLRGLAQAGYAADPRAERAYDWLVSARLEDGAWPTGWAGDVHGFVAGYRRLAHSRWGCRSNTTGALLCLALHPRRRHAPEARRGLDLLLGRETREAYAVGWEAARLVGAEPVRGFITTYARYDLGLVAFLCARMGATRDADERVASLADDLLALRGPHGLWSYAERPQASRWVTLDLLRSLAALTGTAALESAGADDAPWTSTEPRTPFAPYPRRGRRY